MPYINIRIGAKLDPVQREKLYQRTTLLMSTIMRKRREVTVVHLQESDPQMWATNAEILSVEKPVAVYVDIKVTQGTNSTEEKAAMIAGTISMLKEVVGAVQEACYVVIDDISSDSWGYDGKTQAARALSKL